MSAASDLIEEIERRTGRRFEEPGSPVITELFGALAREMGTSNHGEHDDYVAGVLIQNGPKPNPFEGMSDAEVMLLLALRGS